MGTVNRCSWPRGCTTATRRSPQPSLLGADAALKAVWDRYGRLVHTYCARSISDRDLAADCTQETFISAWRSRARFDPATGSLPAWLLGIARHRVFDVYRAQSRAPRPDQDAGDQSTPQEGSDVDELVQRLLVADAVQTLGERAQRVIDLAFYGGYSQTEIASRLDLPLGTVKSDMRRALARLRGVLEGGGIRG